MNFGPGPHLYKGSSVSERKGMKYGWYFKETLACLACHLVRYTVESAGRLPGMYWSILM